MRDSKFHELVDLYLDQEIGANDFRRLQKAVLSSAERLEAFNQACKMRYAERAAFSPESSQFYARELAQLRARLLRRPSRFPAAFSPVRPPRRLKPARPNYQGTGILMAASLAVVILGLSFFKTEFASDMPQPRASTTSSDPSASKAGVEAVATLAESGSAASGEPGFFEAPTLFKRGEVETSLAANFRLSGLDSQAGNPDPFVLSATFDQAYQRMLQQELPGRERPRLILIVPRTAMPESAGANDWSEPDFGPITRDALRQVHLSSARRVGFTR